MAIPSGRRSSDPTPRPRAMGSAPEERGRRGHHDRSESQKARLMDGLARAHVPGRSASRATSTIMIPFFFTMPMSRMIPMSAMTLRSVWVTSKARSAPTPGGRQRRKDGHGMHVALVQHARAPRRPRPGDARISKGSLDSDCWKACAAPEKLRRWWKACRAARSCSSPRSPHLPRRRPARG